MQALHHKNGPSLSVGKWYDGIDQYECIRRITHRIPFAVIGEQLRWNWQSQGENNLATTILYPPPLSVINLVFHEMLTFLFCSTSSYSSSTPPSPAPTPSYFSCIVSATVLERRTPTIHTMARAALIIPTTSSHSLD